MPSASLENTRRILQGVVGMWLCVSAIAKIAVDKQCPATIKDADNRPNWVFFGQFAKWYERFVDGMIVVPILA